MNLRRLGAVVALELVQRVRTVAFYVMLGVFAVILLGVTGLAFAAFSLTAGGGSWLFSLLIMLVLLLVLLVSPTLSGSAVNGDRDAATLAPLQVTQVTTTEIILGKFVAAWITGLAFLAVALPFLVVATLAGDLAPATIATSLAVLVVEVGVVAGIGVGFSAVLARPLFSVACTYLVVAALTIGTLIAFGLGGSALRTEVTTMERYPQYPAYGDSTAMECGPWTEQRYDMPRFDRVWLFLAANPFVILADATPTSFDDYGSPRDLFGQVSFLVASAQRAPDLEPERDYCSIGYGESYPTSRDVVEAATPSWFAGLLVHVVIAGGLLWWGWARTRTPARLLPPGTRIA